MAGLLVSTLQPASGTAIWYPPIAIGMAMLIRRGMGCAILVFLCDWVISFQQLEHRWLPATVLALNATIEAALGALLGRLALSGDGFRSLTRFPPLLLLCGVCATFAGAALGTLLFRLLGEGGSDWLPQGFIWWIGDATSVICILPLLLIWDVPKTTETEPLESGRRAELVTMSLVLGILLIASMHLTRYYFPIVRGAPWIICSLAVPWAAIRFSMRVTAAVIAVIQSTMVLTYWYVQRQLPEGVLSPLATLQILMSLVSINGVALSLALNGERRMRLQWQNSSLQFQESQQRLQRILDNMIEGCQIIDRDYRYRYLNPSALLHSRSKSEDLLGKRMWEAFPGIERLLLFSHIRECMETGKSILFENEFTYADGQTGVFLLSIQPASDGVMILSHDITQTRLQEREAAHMSKLLRAIVEGSTDFISVKDVDGRILLVNPSAARFLQRAPEELVGLQDDAILDSDSATRVRDLDTMVMQRRQTEVCEYELSRRNGDRVMLMTMKAPLLDEEGEVAGVISVARDITDIRRAERAVAASETRYRAVFDHVNDALFVTRPDQSIADANHRAVELLERPHDELCRSRLVDLGLPCSADFAPPDTDTPLAQDGLIRQLRTRSGGIRTIEFRLRTFESNGERLELLAGRDVTEQLKAEALEVQHRSQIAHLSRVASVGESTSSLAHELNQPLTAILNYASLLRTSSPTNPAAEDARRNGLLSDIERQTMRAAEIVRGIRRFIQKEPTAFFEGNLNDAIRNALAMIRLELRTARVHVLTELDPALPSVYMDPVQIEQVLINLFQNAIDAMRPMAPDRRMLRVISRKKGDQQLEVLVADTGPGATEEVASRLFEPFFTTKKKGLGLGLPICRSIVEGHGGALKVEANTVQGMIFSFILRTNAQLLE